VVEDTAGPPFRRVAILTFSTEAPVVIILGGMTNRTGRIKVLRRPRRLAQVAIIAGHLGVFPDEGEIGVLVVIKTPLLPFLCSVTIATSVPHLPPVGVLGGVAILALAQSFFVTISGVAKTAIRGEMGPEERKICFVVIEPGAIPTRGLMAVRAVLPQLPIVAIVVEVAVDAQARSLAIRLAAGVARGASHRGVSSLQGEVRHVMIEGLGSEAHDVGASTPMLGMAGSTVGIVAWVLSAVETLLGFDVGGDLLVTVEAEPDLRTAIESAVTAFAVLFDVRVALDDGPRHDQRLDVRSMSGNRRAERGQNKGSEQKQHSLKSPVMSLSQSLDLDGI
jgi:hypothetical protein